MITKQFKFRPTDDPAIVTVTCAAESEWDVDRAVNLLRAASVLYDAVSAASDWLHREQSNFPALQVGCASLLHQLRNAEAAAVGSRPVK